jgi:hypothetical protein
LTIPVLSDGTILAEFSSHVELAGIIQMILTIATILITTSIFVPPNVPGCLPKAPAVVFDDVQLHANG